MGVQTEVIIRDKYLVSRTLCVWFLGIINEMAEGFKLKGQKSIEHLDGHQN